MKLLAFVLLVVTLLSTPSVFAQSLVGINPLDYNEEQARIFNQMTAEEQENLLKAAETNKPEGIVDCFDYYSFGSVQVSLNEKMSPIVPGTPVAFTGQIKNNNDYPVLDLSVYVKIFKVQSDAIKQRLNGDLLVDQFFATKEGINLYDKSTKPVEFVWLAPKALAPGEYRIATYVTSAKQFNLSGLSFTDDVTGNSLSFTVDSSAVNLPVEWDKNNVQINSRNYNFAKPIPKLDGGEIAILNAPVVNPTDQTKVVNISWTTYSWDGLLSENIVKQISETVTLKPKETKRVEFKVPTHSEPVTYVVGKIEVDGGKSFIGVRFANEGRAQARINFPALSDFPIKSGQTIDIFSCFHSVAPEGVTDGKLTLSLLDEEKNEVMSATYTGNITSQMMGFKKDFTAAKGLNKASLVATLAYAGKKEVVTMNYDCSELGEGICLSDKEVMVSDSVLPDEPKDSPINKALVFGLLILVLIVIIVMLFLKKKKLPDVPMAGPMMLLIAISVFATPLVAMAGQVTWTNPTPLNAGSFISYGGTGNSINTLADLYITVKYVTSASKANNALVQTGDVITINTPTSATDIDWFATSGYTDSPYGKWGNTFDVGCLYGSNYLDSAGMYTEHFGQAIVTRPTPTISATGMSCVGTGPFTCTVTAPNGPVSATVTFPITNGSFRFEGWLWGETNSPDMPMGLIENDGSFFSGLWKRMFTTLLPTANAAMARPEFNTCNELSPVPFTVDERTVTHNFTVDNGATQPNLTAGAVIPNTAVTGMLTSFSAVVTNNGAVATAGAFPNIIKVATGPNGGGVVSNLSAGTQNAPVPAGDTVGITADYTFGSAGTYSMQACADQTGGTQVESNEGDNCGPWTNISVSDTMPNTCDWQTFFDPGAGWELTGEGTLLIGQIQDYVDAGDKWYGFCTAGTGAICNNNQIAGSNYRFSCISSVPPSINLNFSE